MNEEGMFGVEPVGFEDSPRPLDDRMAEAPTIWRTIAERHHLAEPDVDRLASWWHTDGDLGRNIECLTDMTKSRKAGFLVFVRLWTASPTRWSATARRTSCRGTDVARRPRN